MTPYTKFYKSHYFTLEELVDPVTLATLGESAWGLFDSHLLSTLDRIRERYGKPMTVNNWKLGGKLQYRGFRPSDCVEGAKLSSHRRGQACDFDVKGMTAEEVRADIIANPEHIDFMFLTRIEAGTSWVHIETTNQPARIVVFQP
jgi:hypothetical protein